MAEKRKSVRAYIEDIQTSISRIEEYLEGVERNNLSEDYRIRDGIERNIEKYPKPPGTEYQRG